MRRCSRAMALFFALLTAITALPSHAAVFHTDVRVLLSVGAKKELPFTPVGSYHLKEDPSLVIGTEELTVKAVGSRPVLQIGDKTVTATTLTLVSENYGETADYIRLKNDDYGTCTYLGNMTFDVVGGCVRAINTLPIEQYLYGVVPHEMSNSFPVEALKAQAVCARGYAVAKCTKNAAGTYDILDTSQDQVYRGYASKNKRAIAAVDDTKGKVLTYEGDIIEAYYSASNGGQTERTGNVWKTDLPYYTNADDPYDLLNPSSLAYMGFIPAQYNDDTLSSMDQPIVAALQRGANEAAGKTVTLISTVDVVPFEPSYEEPSRCYSKAKVVLIVDDGQKQGQVNVVLQLDELDFGTSRNILGLISRRSTSLRMRGAEPGSMTIKGTRYDGWYLTVRRYGHGIGLSQRSAQQRARDGQVYTDILSFYYVGTELDTMGTFETAPKLSSETYDVRAWGITGIAPQTTPDKLIGRLKTEGERLLVVTAKGAEKKEDPVCTGNFVRTVYDDGRSFMDLPIVIYGDINGDGNIGNDDITTLRSHLMHAQVLFGAYLSAADVNHDDEVNGHDLLQLLKYTQDEAKIRQGS